MPRLWDWVQRIDATWSLIQKLGVAALGGAGVSSLLQLLVIALANPAPPWWAYLLISGVCAAAIIVIICRAGALVQVRDGGASKPDLPCGEPIGPDLLLEYRPCDEGAEMTIQDLYYGERLNFANEGPGTIRRIRQVGPLVCLMKLQGEIALQNALGPIKQGGNSESRFCVRYRRLSANETVETSLLGFLKDHSWANDQESATFEYLLGVEYEDQRGVRLLRRFDLEFDDYGRIALTPADKNVLQ